jgi:hypothetical protein
MRIEANDYCIYWLSHHEAQHFNYTKFLQMIYKFWNHQKLLLVLWNYWSNDLSTS